MALTEHGRCAFAMGIAPPTPQVILEVVLEEAVIVPSALKHGLDETEILHAYRNPVRIWDLGDAFT